MGYSDFLGNSIEARQAETARGIDDFVDGVLSYETRAANILAAADGEPDNVLANAYAAMLWLFLEAPDAAERARPYLDRARAHAREAGRRANLTLKFTEAWAREDIPRAELVGRALNGAFPRDLLIVKVRQYFAFNAGDFQHMLRIAEAALPYNLDIAQMHGMAAFAYEQCHRLDEAERAARRALELKTKEPWAQHALAHVMLTQGRIDEGAAFLESVRDTWAGLNSFMLTHNYWHLGLFYLSQGRFSEALGLYDDHIWGADKTYSQDQIGAVSYLARLEFAGVGVGDRWDDLGQFLAARQRDVVQPFLSLQYLYGLGRAGRQDAASTLFHEIESAARSTPAHAVKAWRDVALPAAAGIVAYHQGAHAEAARQLAQALPRMEEIGGSHAQRDLFAQIYIDALIKAEDNTAALHALEQRRQFDPDGVSLNRLLAGIYARLGRQSDARAALTRANKTRARVNKLDVH